MRTPTPPHPARSGSLADRLFQPVDIAPLVLFRVVIGLIGLWEVSRYIERGWVRMHYIDPVFHFTYYPFTWVKPWPGDLMHLHFAVLGAVSLCVALGLFYRVSAALFFLGWTYVFLLDQARYLNHMYLFPLLALAAIFLPAHRARSVDVWLDPAIQRDTAPMWTLALLRFQIGLVYFFAGLAKLNADWLRGHPMCDWLDRRSGDPLLGALFSQEWAGIVFSWSGALLDLLIVPALLWSRTRAPAALLAVAFHALNSYMFTIGIFPWVMILTLPIFFEPSWLRRWLVFPPLSRAVLEAAEREHAQPAGRWRRQAILTLLGLFVFYNLFMPLRHWLYPGDVAWTEEGHRFAWRMKLRAKHGEILFVVGLNNPPEEREIDPITDLTADQVSNLATHPDMIIQYAHHLRDRFEAEGRGPVRVYARAVAVLHDREPAPIVDPLVDLASRARNLLPARWITAIPPISTGREQPGPAQGGDVPEE